MALNVPSIRHFFYYQKIKEANRSQAGDLAATSREFKCCNRYARNLFILSMTGRICRGSQMHGISIIYKTMLPFNPQRQASL